MKKILKAPNNLVRKVLSKTSLSSSHSMKEKKIKNSMSEEHQLELEIKSLKTQIQSLRDAIKALQKDTEKKEVAIARIAREKEKITMELFKEQRSKTGLLQQLEDERKFYYKEKETYCEEMNKMKKLKQVFSNTTTISSVSNKQDDLSVAQLKKEIVKVKLTLNQTLEANYNLSIKFLRMKNTKTCLKTELKTMQLEHEKLVNDYKAKIEDLSRELNDLIQERLNSPISCSSKKYLHLVKQNSCLVYENLCLQLEVDNMHLKYEKFKLDKSRSETNDKLKYIKHSTEVLPKIKTVKKVRIKEDKPEKDSGPSTSSSNQIKKLYERKELPGIPDIKLLRDFEATVAFKKEPQRDIPSVQEKKKDLKKILEKSNSKLSLFQVSNNALKITRGTLPRVRSSPDLSLARAFIH